MARHSASADAELDAANQRLGERLCRVGSARGAAGTIEYVYRSRRTGHLIARVLMETGAVRRVDTLEVYVY